jgi:hypothetical protein
MATVDPLVTQDQPPLVVEEAARDNDDPRTGTATPRMAIHTCLFCIADLPESMTNAETKEADRTAVGKRFSLSQVAAVMCARSPLSGLKVSSGTSRHGATAGLAGSDHVGVPSGAATKACTL